MCVKSQIGLIQKLVLDLTPVWIALIDQLSDVWHMFVHAKVLKFRAFSSIGHHRIIISII